mmetsp:Transcript_20839/g.26918  ORF Transcript_20839/g.26918 Transcript_20839/m.26918 type:complete len:162 (+) Transcript_20839:118-603(+)
MRGRGRGTQKIFLLHTTFPVSTLYANNDKKLAMNFLTVALVLALAMIATPVCAVGSKKDSKVSKSSDSSKKSSTTDAPSATATDACVPFARPMKSCQDDSGCDAAEPNCIGIEPGSSLCVFCRNAPGTDGVIDIGCSLAKPSCEFCSGDVLQDGLFGDTCV